MTGQTRAGSARLNAYHGTKRQLTGTSAGQVAPAWRSTNGAAAANGSTSPLSKKAGILLSNLPMDVAETEIEELFKRTVGPIKDMFIIYNSQGRSKGMAVVTFQRATDAVSARSKYDGKVIDGKHKLKIELVTDSDEPLPEVVKEQPSLLSRIAGTRPTSDPTPRDELPAPPPQRPVKKHTFSIAVSGPKKRTKKGPKRVKKSLAQLDQEMEDYRASVTDRKAA
ncbi:hypothetical protein EDB92DRAFT_1874310 [Lactarius akahatsu]|uniref:RRM domain-containing protein n=1 Tax=Lactarius akahatsu TaxID=416441 RepID=A0AAD4Q8Z8_9AGAM|nr:hypothetical protein EDB92DRAFT_1874310 [Lactarius akahatsu]